MTPIGELNLAPLFHAGSFDNVPSGPEQPPLPDPAGN
jgi:hypothetical protein